MDFATARDKAFTAFVNDGDFSHIDAFTECFGLRPLPHNDVGAAAVYKAVGQCVNIDQETKNKARMQCELLGFSTDFMGVKFDDGQD